MLQILWDPLLAGDLEDKRPWALGRGLFFNLQKFISLKNNPETPCVLLEENPVLTPKFTQEYKLLGR